MINDVRVVGLLLAGTSHPLRTSRVSHPRFEERTSWWRRRKSRVVETAPPRVFEQADARAHAHVDLTGEESRKRFWQKELRLRRRREADPAVFAVEDESHEADDDNWFVSDAQDLDAVESTDGREESELEERPRRRWFGRTAKSDDVEADEAVPVDADENAPVAEEKPRRRWFARDKGEDVEVDEVGAAEAEVEVDRVDDGFALEADGEDLVAEEKPRRRWFGRKEKSDDVEVDEVFAVEAEGEELVAEEKPRRRWFARDKREDVEVDEVVAAEAEADSVTDAGDGFAVEADGDGFAVEADGDGFAVEADGEELVAEEKPRRRWFGRKEKSDDVEVDEVFAVEADGEELVAEEKPRRRWFGRKEKHDAVDAVDRVLVAEADPEEPVAEEKSRRRWLGRKAVDAVDEGFAVEADAEELVADEKPRRRWFGRKNEDAAVLPLDEARDEIVSGPVEADADQHAEASARRRWFGRKSSNDEIEPSVESVAADSNLEDDQPADEDKSRRRWFGRSKEDEGRPAPEVEVETLAADASELEYAAEAGNDWVETVGDAEPSEIELPMAESLPAPSFESGPEVEVDSANRQVRELLAWWNEVQAAAGQTDQQPVHEAAPAAPPVEEPVPAASVSLDPVAIEPVTVEPIAVEPVAVEPVSVEPVSVEPIVEIDAASPAAELPEPVEPERADVPQPITDSAEAAETVEITPQPVEPLVEPVQVVDSEAVADAEPAAPRKKSLSFSLRRDKNAESDDASRPERKARLNATKLKRSRGVKRIVGLKIGASQIAAAHVANNGSPELVQLARQPIEQGIVVGGELRDPEALAEALTDFFKKHKLPKKGVRLGIASNRIGVRSFQITGIDDPKQLTNAVRFRAQDALPIPLNEAALDYQVLEESVDETGATVRRVLLVVAYRDLVNRYVDACRKAGIKLIGVDLEAFAVLRALAAPRPAEVDPAGALVVVSVGHDRSTLAVSDGRVCEFTRVLDWGGASLDVALARALDVTPREADPVKRQLSLDGTGPLPIGLDEEQATKARQAMLDQINVFARELVSSLHFYQSQPGSLEIGEIVLTGGGSHLEGLAAHLQQLTGVNVRVGDPLVRMTLKKKAESPDPVGSLAVAIGLGIED